MSEWGASSDLHRIYSTSSRDWVAEGAHAEKVVYVER